MSIDKTTELKFVNITISDNKKYLDSARKEANEFEENSEELVTERGKVLTISNDKAQFETEEYYYDETENIIHFSGTLRHQDGETNLYIEFPLSDTVLIDILKQGIKKLNKLKTALETLK